MTAEAGNEKKTVRFRILRGEDDNYSRYGPAFSNLPKLLEDGDITDSELAKILRQNRMPPGIVNNLIKTGKLGDESIDAILSYQFNPPGIMMKFWGWMGLRQLGYSEQIYDMYNVNDTHWEKMLQRGDLSGQKAKIIKEKLAEKVKQGKGNSGKSWRGGHK